jgi:hypothetical protein
MPIGSGSVSATGINLELGRSSNAALSIDTAENGGYVAINSCSPFRPSSSNPASYSEWRRYDHAYACCNAPTITSVTAGTSSLTVNFSTSNCTAVHLEYSTNGSSWSTTTVGCSSPQTIGGLASGTSYIVRMRITCTSTGGYSSYSNATTMSTGASYPAYGTYLSSYCSGCTLYYRYADGSGGSYDVSQGCSTSCGGCCCATPAGTYLYQNCSGCDLYNYYADGCNGTYSSFVESDSPTCGCGGGGRSWCQFGQTEGTGRYNYVNCQGQMIEGEAYWAYDLMDCIDIFQPFRGVRPLGTDCSFML